ncbi:hypothetical protein [Acetobacter syzygii]|uniref:Uncharacterized protein n=2 Tax=Bacteria TaxID=2 RepID=A0A270B4Q7_9PROT|nr:hypothetical protein [Acetobacter syzygii]PAL19983.1 hypothetical protein B9K05_13510 [Acetobacter syzygii]PAL20865.1 hypothetical protein B9K04_13450 [Acetobacter syzygii]
MPIYAAVRAGALKSISSGRSGIRSAEQHAKRLDPVARKRHVRESDPIAWSKAETGPLDYEAAFKAHKRATGAGERKGADLGMEFKVVVSPEWLAETGDPHDASNPRVKQLVAEAKAWAESWGGADSVWGLRYDTDERGSGVVDVFMSPVREQRHKSGKAKKVISCRKAKEELLASERAIDPDLKTSGAAMQSSWSRWCQKRLDPRLERGKAKTETGAVHENADLYARIAEKKAADLARREKRLGQASRFVQAFASGDVTKVGPRPEDPEKLTFWRKNSLPDERKAELSADWRTVPQPLRDGLHAISAERARAEAARKEAESVAEQTKKAISEGVQAFWKREITGARQDAAKEWHLAYDPRLPSPRRSALASIIEPVKALIAPMLCSLAAYLGQSRVNISEYAAAQRDDDLDIGWDNGLGM